MSKSFSRLETSRSWTGLVRSFLIYLVIKAGDSDALLELAWTILLFFQINEGGGL